MQGVSRLPGGTWKIEPARRVSKRYYTTVRCETCSTAPGPETFRTTTLDPTHASMSHEFRNFIAGEWIPPRTGDYFDNRNPARTDDLIGHFPRSGKEDVDAAVQAAKRGFEIW